MRALYHGEEEDTGWVNDLTNSLALSNNSYLRRVPTVTGNRRQFTILMNIRLINHSQQHWLINAGPSFYYRIRSDGKVEIGGVAATGTFISDKVIRDTEWFFLGVAYDTVAQTIKVVMNDEELTGTFTPQSVNYQTNMNTLGGTMDFGSYNSNNSDESNYDTSDMVLLDGEVLTPAEMIDYRTRTVPFGNNVVTTTKKFDISGQHSYGVNGCQLLFEDGGDLGKSTAGNLTSWSTPGITPDDQLTDTPGDPYAVLSDIHKQSQPIISDGGLRVTYGGSANSGVTLSSRPFPNSGKWYYEHEYTAVSSFDYFIGILPTSVAISDSVNVISAGVARGEYAYRFTGQKQLDGVISSYGAAYTAGDVIGVAVDMDNLEITFYKGGVSQGTITIVDDQYYMFTQTYGGGTAQVNFGQRPFAHTVPTGFKELKSSNLSTPQHHGRDKFDINLSTGTGAVRDILTPFDQIGLVWGKARTSAFSHRLEDGLRGAGKGLFPDTTTAEETRTDSITDFSPGGFSFGVDAGSGYNQNGVNYAYWIFGNDGTEVTNNDGTVPSQVIADSSGYMSLATYTATGSGDTYGHGGSRIPDLTFHKGLTGAKAWASYVKSEGADYFLQLDTSGGKLSSATYNVWNGRTEPTNSVMSVGPIVYTGSAGPYMAIHIWSVEGLSKVFSYKGNGSIVHGPHVDCGFKPRWILLKRVDAAGSWSILDTERDTINSVLKELNPDLSSAETVAAGSRLDITSQGFTIRTTGAAYNASGGEYIGLAIADVAGGGNLPAILGN